MTAEQVAHQRSTATQPEGGFLTLDRVYVAGALAVAVAAALCTIVRPHDFWWHLANGRTIVTTGVFPTADTFTYTQQGEPFFNQMWLAQVWMYLLYRAGGVALVVTAHAAAIGLAYAMLLRLCVRLTGRYRLSALLLLAVVLPLSFSNWAVRPQPYAFPLFVAFLAALIYDSETPDRSRAVRQWSLPLLMTLWVNIHGSYVLGLGMVTLAAVMALMASRTTGSPRDARRLVLVAIATWLATSLNPRGPAVLAYVVKLMTNPSVATVSEWQPLAPVDFASTLYYVIGLLLVVVLVYSSRRPEVKEVLVAIGLLLLGFTAQRHTTWFALAGAPLLALHLGAMLKRPRPDPGIPAMNVAVVAMLAVAIGAALPWSRVALAPPPLNTLTMETPVAATQALAEMPERPERLYNDVGYGSYLAYALPSQKTFIDTRFELFPGEQVDDYRALAEGRDLEAMLAKYDFDALLLSHEYQPALIDRLEQAQDWTAKYEDSEAVLFVPQE